MTEENLTYNCHVLKRIHSWKTSIFFILWLRTLACDLDLWTWPRKGQTEPACQISRSKASWFKSYCRCMETQTHTPDRLLYLDH